MKQIYIDPSLSFKKKVSKYDLQKLLNFHFNTRLVIKKLKLSN